VTSSVSSPLSLTFLHAVLLKSPVHTRLGAIVLPLLRTIYVVLKLPRRVVLWTAKESSRLAVVTSQHCSSGCWFSWRRCCAVTCHAMNPVTERERHEAEGLLWNGVRSARVKETLKVASSLSLIIDHHYFFTCSSCNVHFVFHLPCPTSSFLPFYCTAYSCILTAAFGTANC
jgi:hypothetical protein